MCDGHLLKRARVVAKTKPMTSVFSPGNVIVRYQNSKIVDASPKEDSGRKFPLTRARLEQEEEQAKGVNYVPKMDSR